MRRRLLFVSLCCSSIIAFSFATACTPTSQPASDDSKGEVDEKQPDGPVPNERVPNTDEPVEPEPEPEPDTEANAEPPPSLDTTCEDESDCTNSHADVFDDGTCCFGCGGDPANLLSASKLSRWCSDHVRNDCPKKKCAAPPSPKCVDGECVSRY